jgi:hypothetical protein
MILGVIGACLGIAGVLMMALNGFVADYGGKPFVTWPYALIAFVLGLGCFVWAARLLRRRRD